MAIRTWRLIALMLIYNISRSDADNIEKDVLTLNDETLNATLQNPEHATLLALAPEYGEAATELKHLELPVVLAKVDATVSPKTAEWLEIKGYPTILWFQKGSYFKYEGKRKSQDIVFWIKKKIGPPADTLSSLEDLHKLTDLKSEVFLLGYFSEFQAKLSSPFYPISVYSNQTQYLWEVMGTTYSNFEEAARAIKTWSVYQTTSLEIAKAFNLSKPDSFAVGTKFELNNRRLKSVESDSHPAFQSKKNLSEQILEFVLQEEMPPYLPYSNDNNDRIFALPQQVFILGPKNELRPGSKILKAVEGTQKNFKGRFAFATASYGSDSADLISNFFGVESKTKDLQVVGFQPDTKKYRLLEPLTESSLTQFCKGVEEDSYPRFFKSMPIPEKAVEGYVQVVVGQNFDEIVLDHTKDVLLLLYTRWSEKSKHVTSVWKRIARHLRNVESIVVAKFEASENEHRLVTTQGVPSIWMYPAKSSKEGIKMVAEDPNFKEILRFARKNAALGLQSPEVLSSTGHEEL